MCACRCGIDVHLKDGKIRYIDGNRDHPVNRGVLCGKGSAGIMQHYSPARLRKPLLRVGERGAGEFREIEWDEALAIATERLARIRATDPKKLAFFTGRDQSQSLTGWWAMQFGTPNFAAHGGFCSVNMAAGGLYTIGGSFWEFGEPDWDHTQYFMLFGVAEDHDSNPIKIGLGKLKARGAKFVSINPCRTGYNAIADEWIGIRPGTDGLFVLALVHELLKAGRIDLDYLVALHQRPWLVIQEPGAADDGLFLRDADGKPLAWDRAAKRRRRRSRSRCHAGADRQLHGRRPPLRAGLPAHRRALSRRQLRARRGRRALRHSGRRPSGASPPSSPMSPSSRRSSCRSPGPTGPAAGTRRCAGGRSPCTPCAASRPIPTASTPAARIHLLQVLLGTVDVPGGFRFKPPYPAPAPPGPKPAGKDGGKPMTPLAGMPLGFVSGPEDLLVDDAGTPMRIDKAYSWDAPLAAHGLMHMVIRNAWRRRSLPDRHAVPVHGEHGLELVDEHRRDHRHADRQGRGRRTTRSPSSSIPTPIISETVAYADLVLPDTTYLERHDCISLLDRPISHADGPGDAIRQPVVEPDRDVRPFQAVLIDLGARLGLPGFVDEDGTAEIPRLRRLHRQPRAHARHRPARRLARRGRRRHRQGRAQSRPARALHRQWRLLAPRACRRPALLQDGQPRLSRLRGADGLHPDGRADRLPALFRAAAALPPRRARPWPRAAAGERTRSASRPTSTRCRSGTRRSRRRRSTADDIRCMRSRSGRCTCTIPGARRTPGCGRSPARTASSCTARPLRGLGLVDDDWVWIESHQRPGQGADPADRRRQPGHGLDLERHRQAPRRLEAEGRRRREPSAASCSTTHIGDLLPADANGKRYSNSDPVTGQAAWFDLRVRIVKCARRRSRRRRAAIRAAAAAAGISSRRPTCFASAPQFRRRQGGSAMTCLPAHTDEEARPGHRPRHLRRLPGLRDRCKEWNTGGHMAPLTDLDPYGGDADGVWFNRVHSYEHTTEARRAARCISRAPACIAKSRPASPSARPAPPTSAPRTASCWSTRTTASAASCAAGPAPTARASSTPTSA